MNEVEELLRIAHDPAASLDERASAADRLAGLGDPRALRVDRVAIPAGPFVYGPPGGEREREVEAFEIDRHPVTVAAFAELIESGGYADDRFWSAEGRAWRVEESIVRPRFWGEEQWAAYLIPNHPVVGVSFWEADAYAAFKGARLPTEVEWEKACRGTDGRAYPWGSSWLDDACGQRGVGPRGTTAIGIFPRGVGPYGVADMVGCVWQWCVDLHDGAASMRVTRGGAWNNLPRLSSATSRNGYPERARFSNLGFRCVTGLQSR